MAQRKNVLESTFAQRRKQLLRHVKGDALLLVSAPRSRTKRDQEYPFNQESNFFYATGLIEPESMLLLRGLSKGPRSVLFLRDRDRERERWEGERLGVKRAQRRFQVDEVRDSADFRSAFPELVQGAATLHHSVGIDQAIDDYLWALYRERAGRPNSFPHTLRDARLLLHQMRAVKDRHEVQAIRHAVEVSAQGFRRLAAYLPTLRSEVHAAKSLEAEFASLGLPKTAFQTIVASGKNATCLHHAPGLQPLWKKQLVLIDAGAEYRGYAGDISRTLPVNGRFSPPQAAVYDIVLNALKAGIKRTAPGVPLGAIHDTVTRELTRGLVQLGVLRGEVSRLHAEKQYAKYYMHRTSHFLGLDVHDVAPSQLDRFNRETAHDKIPLMPKNIITIEPGLYFDSADKELPTEYRGIGIRLEEDVIITKDGCEVLSASMPVEREEIEELMK